MKLASTHSVEDPNMADETHEVEATHAEVVDTHGDPAQEGLLSSLGLNGQLFAFN